MAITNRDIDKQQLSVSEYIDKYYSNVNLDDWIYWMNSNIDAAWTIERRKELRSSWGERMANFDFDKMMNFFNQEDLSPFDDDIKKFISFLAGDSFFETNRISYNEWLAVKNFTNPLKGYAQDVTIEEALKLKGGMNYIRKQLVNLHWWRR